MAAAATAGLVLGSFAAAVSWRVPRGKGWVSTRSSCPACDRKLDGMDLVPVASWVALGGRCRTCKAPISPRYPVIELAGAALFCAAVPVAPNEPMLLVLWLLALLLLIPAVIDLEKGYIPTGAAVAVAVLGAGASWMGATVPPLDAVIGSAIGGGAMLALWAGLSRGLGWPGVRLDDAKLAAAAGLWLGPLAAAGLIAAALAAWILAALSVRGMGAPVAVPPGPFLAFGTYGVVLASLAT